METLDGISFSETIALMLPQALVVVTIQEKGRKASLDLTPSMTSRTFKETG